MGDEVAQRRIKKGLSAIDGEGSLSGGRMKFSWDCVGPTQVWRARKAEHYPSGCL